jgi:hypothetical protein
MDYQIAPVYEAYQTRRRAIAKQLEACGEKPARELANTLSHGMFTCDLVLKTFEGFLANAAAGLKCDADSFKRRTSGVRSLLSETISLRDQSDPKFREQWNAQVTFAEAASKASIADDIALLDIQKSLFEVAFNRTMRSAIDVVFAIDHSSAQIEAFKAYVSWIIGFIPGLGGIPLTISTLETLDRIRTSRSKGLQGANQFLSEAADWREVAIQWCIVTQILGHSLNSKLDEQLMTLEESAGMVQKEFQGIVTKAMTEHSVPANT